MKLQGVTVVKGYDLYKRVLNLLGYMYSDDSITSDNLLYKRALYAINQILSDLGQNEIADMNCEIKLSKPQLDALIYGVAMLLSIIGGDGERNRLFTNLYNAKRGAVLNRVDAVADAMPKVDGGAI